ncbi:calcium/sodium antiporter [Halobacteriovorax sp. HLS]|uniref:calcium/sodium antiporter n=1 Tax=Halobacteriovorax sp. HLS TaxID=2234000 RepID=UPI000FD9FB96|nr:calcium/sodium antiporter [Halobacteriovorax sp. HLS]
MTLQVVLLVLAIVMLYFGAEFALESAEKIGLFLGMSPLVIGLLIVGFGTSLPEFFVSQLACFRGETPIALGNIVGSNIANLFLIMGLTGMAVPLYMAGKEIKVQLFFHIVLTAILSFILLQTKLFWWGSALLVGFFIVYLTHTFRGMAKERHLRNASEEETIHEITPIMFVKLLIGFVLLYLGGELLVSSGSKIGAALGISTYVISAVFVAFGTSFPELVTALLACVKKKNTDLITGNIIGSNIFNVAFVLGSLGFYDVAINKDYTLEISVLVFASVFLIGLSLIKRNFYRFSGIAFFGTYLFVVYNWVAK